MEQVETLNLRCDRRRHPIRPRKHNAEVGQGRVELDGTRQIVLHPL
jgi:hypothetical protein